MEQKIITSGWKVFFLQFTSLIIVSSCPTKLISVSNEVNRPVILMIGQIQALKDPFSIISVVSSILFLDSYLRLKQEPRKR